MNKFILFASTLLLVSCTSFDSNQLNKRLIQGNWIQTEIASFTLDSLYIEPQTDKNNTLIFRGDSCIETIEELDSIKYYTFDIKNYFIGLEEKESPTTFLRINKLTEDSLILQATNRILRYKRKVE